MVLIIILSGPSKPRNTDSVFESFKKFEKHTPGLQLRDHARARTKVSLGTA